MKKTPYFLCYDFETSSVDPHTTQILQIAACIIDARSCTIVDKFDSLVKPEDEKTIDSKALEVNKLNLDDLKQAPSITIIFPAFATWISKYNIYKDRSPWGAPISCGWNITNFDNIILNRYARKLRCIHGTEPNLIHPIISFDCMHTLFWLTYFNNDISSYKLTSILEYCGISKRELEKAHNAIYDVEFCAQLAIKLIKLSRHFNEVNNGKRRLEIKNSLKGK